ncbi:alpha/beta hydrolase family protein [Paenibacillus sp. FSL R7-0331]|uniref:alpha/beta hydrolase family protein n=1 Tax=Paenibacillus sp. FSL R7-0331 TaxID=1536773 RepID=UPI0004F5FA7E|nr:alpha/beta fold hydrolase [Paenibacillus sp. FSL R7-0331]AIQ54137.1 alpha/beta hydrolase [Paenibacillus sp. FSL R7-0331]
MKKKIIAAIIVVSLILLGAALYIVRQNTFDMVEQPVEITTPQGQLTGTLVLPKHSSGKSGLVLFIHGDGPINASHDDGYKPLWERMASLGYASLSLDKRGIGGSEGNWLNQSIGDRVEEARHVLAWAREQPSIDSSRIGVWGASQAGWVIPELAAAEPLAFSILVSPAINWLRQGAFNTEQQMLKDGYTQEEISGQAAYEQRVNELLQQGAPYEDYVQLDGPEDRMSEARWSFVSQNFRADAENDLQSFQSPVLLLLGEEDLNVDVKETEDIYRRQISPASLLTVRVFPDTEHSMLRTATADSSLRALAISLFAPRRITVEGYMEQIEVFLKHTVGR